MRKSNTSVSILVGPFALTRVTSLRKSTRFSRENAIERVFGLSIREDALHLGCEMSIRSIIGTLGTLKCKRKVRFCDGNEHEPRIDCVLQRKSLQFGFYDALIGTIE
eukprot:scaffold15605_cov165-Amphora_coffeaeformis.AAC.3